jgi:hypothetical protein
MPEMNDKKQAIQGQDAPYSVRLWKENAEWFADFAERYNTVNAAFNIVIMRAQGLGDIKIDEECKKHQKVRRKK